MALSSDTHVCRGPVLGHAVASSQTVEVVDTSLSIGSLAVSGPCNATSRPLDKGSLLQGVERDGRHLVEVGGSEAKLFERRHSGTGNDLLEFLRDGAGVSQTQEKGANAESR